MRRWTWRCNTIGCQRRRTRRLAVCVQCRAAITREVWRAV